MGTKGNIYSRCKNKEVIVSEHMYDCENDDKPRIDSQLNPSECVMLKDFEYYNVHGESAEIEKWSTLNITIDYVEYNRKELPSNRVKSSHFRRYSLIVYQKNSK